MVNGDRCVKFLVKHGTSASERRQACEQKGFRCGGRLPLLAALETRTASSVASGSSNTVSDGVSARQTADTSPRIATPASTSAATAALMAQASREPSSCATCGVVITRLVSHNTEPTRLVLVQAASVPARDDAAARRSTDAARATRVVVRLILQPMRAEQPHPVRD
jgi:hypothetical protein